MNIESLMTFEKMDIFITVRIIDKVALVNNLNIMKIDILLYTLKSIFHTEISTFTYTIPDIYILA